MAFDVATRMNIKGGTDKPTPNQTLPFRERLGCSPSEACVALGVGRTFLYKLIAEHRIEVSKLGRRTIISIPSLLKLLGARHEFGHLGSAAVIKDATTAKSRKREWWRRESPVSALTGTGSWSCAPRLRR